MRLCRWPMHGRDGRRSSRHSPRKALLPLRSILWLPEKVRRLRADAGGSPCRRSSESRQSPSSPATRDGARHAPGRGAPLRGRAGRLLAVMDATSITAIRTAAASGVATRCLARKDAEDLAIVGSGTWRERTWRRWRPRSCAACGSRARSSAARRRSRGASRESTDRGRAGRVGEGGDRRSGHRLHDDLLAQPVSASGSRPASTSTRSGRAFRPRASSTRRPS
jgi:hypothetical protein